MLCEWEMLDFRSWVESGSTHGGGECPKWHPNINGSNNSLVAVEDGFLLSFEKLPCLKHHYFISFLGEKTSFWSSIVYSLELKHSKRDKASWVGFWLGLKEHVISLQTISDTSSIHMFTKNLNMFLIGYQSKIEVDRSPPKSLISK